MENLDNDNSIKHRIKKHRDRIIVLIIVIALVFLTAPYIYNCMSWEQRLRSSYRNFPHIATISITNLNQKEYGKAIGIIEARTDWVLNQKSDWDKHGRRPYDTLDLSESDKITVVFGYEEGFDINAFTNEITKVADLHFIDLNDNPIIDNSDIISARYAFQGATQSYDVILKLTEVGKQKFLKSKIDEAENNMRIEFKGSIPSDLFTAKAADNNIVIKGFINSGAAESLVKLIELRDPPNGLKVELHAK